MRTSPTMFLTAAMMMGVLCACAPTPGGEMASWQTPLPEPLRREQARRGEADARRDIERGELRLWTWGRLPASAPVYHRLLREHYGIETTVRGCVTLSHEATYRDAYNRVMREEIALRFSPDVLDRTRELAQRMPRDEW